MERLMKGYNYTQAGTFSEVPTYLCMQNLHAIQNPVVVWAILKPGQSQI